MVKITSMTDAELVKAYAQGNNDAFDQLLKKYSDKVFAYIIRTVKNEDVANDIFQDTFVKAILTIKQGRYTENGKFPAWITGRQKLKICRAAAFRKSMYSTAKSFRKPP